MRDLCVLGIIATLVFTPGPLGADEAKDAEDVLRAYLADVAAQIRGNLESFKGQDAVMKKFQELGEKHLLKNKDILHKKAAKDYLQLEVWDPKDRLKLKSLREGMKDLKQFENIYQKEGYGIPPFDRHSFATLWWEPQFAAKTLRGLCYGTILPEEESSSRRYVEQFAAPRVYRRSNDPKKPVIAFFDGKELFVVSLVYTEVGIYAVDKLEWFQVSSDK